MIDDAVMTLGQEEFSKVHAKSNKYKSRLINSTLKLSNFDSQETMRIVNKRVTAEDATIHTRSLPVTRQLCGARTVCF